MKINKLLLFSLVFLMLLAGCDNTEAPYHSDTPKEERTVEKTKISHQELVKRINDKFQSVTPSAWGENIEGVITKINTEKKIIALTFDACGGKSGLEYDQALIEFLIEEEIPATLFFSGKWIEANEEVFLELAKNPLFEIANHGYRHLPLSVNGNSAYNIKGTQTVQEVLDEIYNNQALIKELTGRYPKYYRSGTAYYDDVAVKIIYELGLKPINYNVLGDAGATFNKKQIVRQMISAKEGSILLFHMNHPNSEVAQGVMEGIRQLKEKGFEFVRLGDYDQYLK